jgi:hypothetical protein
MEEIASFVINNVSNNFGNEIQHYVEQTRTDMNLDDICEGLFEVLDEYKTKEFAVSNNSLGEQIYTLISFNYEGRKCEFGEHFTEDKDYFWVKIYAVDA